MNIERKTDFGEETLTIPATIKIWDIRQLLMDRNYSSPRMINNYTQQLVSNDGKHNAVRINFLEPQKMTWFYTAPDGEEQTKEIRDYFKNLFEEGGKQ